MPLYAGVGGVSRTVNRLSAGVDGVCKPVTLYAGVDGVSKEIGYFYSENLDNAVMQKRLSGYYTVGTGISFDSSTGYFTITDAEQVFYNTFNPSLASYAGKYVSGDLYGITEVILFDGTDGTSGGASVLKGSRLYTSSIR